MSRSEGIYIALIVSLPWTTLTSPEPLFLQPTWHDDVTDPRQGRGHTRDNPSLENATILSSSSSLWIDLYLLRNGAIG